MWFSNDAKRTPPIYQGIYPLPFGSFQRASKEHSCWSVGLTFRALGMTPEGDSLKGNHTLEGFSGSCRFSFPAYRASKHCIREHFFEKSLGLKRDTKVLTPRYFCRSPTKQPTLPWHTPLYQGCESKIGTQHGLPW